MCYTYSWKQNKGEVGDTINEAIIIDDYFKGLIHNYYWFYAILFSNSITGMYESDHTHIF